MNSVFSRRTATVAMGASASLLALVLAACGGGGSDNASAVSYDSSTPFVVGTTTYDADLPAAPTLPTDAQVCTTLEASNTLVKRPADGALPYEADPSVSGNRVAASAATTNPDQARIQAALDACGASVYAEVGAAMAAQDAADTAAQKAAATGANIAGTTGEEFAKSTYRPSKFAVRLTVSSTGSGDSFISGPLTLPSGVTLWIDKGVTLFASRDVMLYNNGTKYCGNTQTPSGAGSSGNCLAFITGTNTINSAVVGEGAIDSRAYAEIVTTNKYYPIMKVDLTCSNTYAAYKTSTFAADGTPCDNGGTVVSSKSTVRNMTWWDLAYLGNLVESGTTGSASQSTFRMMYFSYAKNLTLYGITLSNSANFHVVPQGVDGLTVWGVKVLTPSLAAFANPAGNGNPLYTGATFTEDNVKNTDAFDPASAGGSASVQLYTGSTTKSTAKFSFDGYLKNVVFAYNYISTGDDDIAIKGSNNPGTIGLGVDGSRGVRSDRKYGLVIAHNHIYWGHGISIGSETSSGVTNMHVYDNSFNGSEEALRIKTDVARGGEVSNIYYKNICARDTDNALLFTPYYSTKAVTGTPTVFPNFHDITLENMYIEDSTKVRFQGFEANSSGYGNPQYPLVMSLTNVVAASPDSITLSASSDANLTISGVNLPLASDSDKRIVVTGTATKAVDASKFIDCSKAYVDYPSAISPFGSTWLQ